MGNNSFTIISFFYSFMILTLYFRRQKIVTPETKIYSAIVISNFFNVLFAVLSYFTITFRYLFNFVNNFVSKTLLICFVTWVMFFTIYLLSITNKNNKDYLKIIKDKKIYWLIYLLFVVVVFYMPLLYYSNNGVVYSYGPSANVAYFIGVVLIIFWFIRIITNFKILRDKKIIPIVLFMILAIVVVIIQKINPQLLLMTAAETFVTVIMYHTIENPDFKMLEELHQSKTKSDMANEEKAIFLYNMTQEIRGTVNEINNNANDILDSDSIEENKDSARNIIATTSKFSTMTNDMLDISNVENDSVKVYNSKYNIKTILKQLVSIYNDKCKNKGLNFITNIDNNVPDEMYGDSIGLKEVLNTILDNAYKYTNKGYVEFDVNTIIKNDICRLIITVEDSGIGIKSENINNLKVSNTSLAKANNLIIKMNGTMLISSDFGVGTKIKVVLDQRIEINTNSEIAKYDNIFNNINILTIDDSEAGLKIIDKLLNGTNIKIDKANTGKECLDKIRINKYDVVLLDENLEEISGLELMKRIKEVRNFNTSVILLTKDNSYEYNEEYLKIGFSDYLLKPIKKDELINKINEYKKKDKA